MDTKLLSDQGGSPFCDGCEIISKMHSAIVEAEQANQVKSDFLSIMSHELRTPLNAIIGLSYLMEREDNIEGFREHNRVLRYSSRVLQSLIDDILDFNRMESGMIELESAPFSMGQLLRDVHACMNIAAQEHHNELRLEVDNDCPSALLGDPLRLGQILNNLLSNACKFTHNGCITICCESLSNDGIQYQCRISVRDTGIGIAKEEFRKIFEKFGQANNEITRKFGGSGLGLLISERLLQLHDSHMCLESEKNKGSTFYFELSLPLAQTQTNLSYPNPNDLLKEAPNSGTLKGLRALLVEDYAVNILVGSKLLKHWEVSVDIAENGKLAVEKCLKNDYDIILMDIHMPVMDGYTATQLIRKLHPQTPIIALTASTTMASFDKAKAHGMNDYLAKPFNPQSLHKKLIQYLPTKHKKNISMN